MTKTEISKAKKMLDDYTERYEVIGDGTGGFDGLILTAHWTDGGQRIFHNFADVDDWLGNNETD